jgi:hypothetical protein
MEMSVKLKTAIKFGLIVSLNVFTTSGAQEAVIPIKVGSEKTTNEVRILGGFLGQSGSGNIVDGYTGVSRSINSDYGFGIRVGAGLSWPHFLASLSGEYLRRNIESSESFVVPDPPDPTKRVIEYDYITFRPEIALKTTIQNAFEIGAISGFGFRSKINSSNSKGGTDQLIMFGCYAQLRGFNLRMSKDIIYQGAYYSESSNISIFAGYVFGIGNP